MTGPLRDEVNSRLPWLAKDFGFQVTNHSYSYKAMGSSSVALRSESINLQFIRDRSRIQLQVAAPAEPDRWYDLGFLWLALTGNPPDPELEGWAWFFREHAAELAEALGPGLEATKASFDQKEKERQEILARYVPPSTPLDWLVQLQRKSLAVAIVMGPLGWVVAIIAWICAASR